MAKTLTPRADDATPEKKAPRSAKPNGQWKIDGKQALNGNEEWKLDDDGLNVRDRILNTYASKGFDSIEDHDLHGRFRWWGLYTQRKPGIDGGKTATLSNEELEDKYFMMRVRIDGGQLTTQQARVIGEISRDFARDTADITDRQNIQLHWVEVENVPEIWRRLDEVGLQTTEACGDVPRVILGSPVAGIAKDELFDPTPVIEKIRDEYIGSHEFSNLPRKFKTAISAHPSQDVIHEINDIALIGVEHPDLGLGFDLWVGGGLSTNPKFAERLGAFVTPEQAPAVWAGVTSIFRDYGYRRLRNRARMKFLLADWGPEKIRDVLETEYLGFKLADGPAAPVPEVSGDHIGVHEQKDGNYYIGAATTVGRFSGSKLIALADLLETNGSHRLRTTVYQKFVALDIPGDKVPAVVQGLNELGLAHAPSLFRRNTMACTGIEFCKLAIVETKDVATEVIAELENRLTDIEDQLPAKLTLHINGCPNSCARIQTADIGLKGQIITVDGERMPGYQVHLGGQLADYTNKGEGNVGRTVRGLKVAQHELADYVERLTRNFVAYRENADQSFASWALDADEELLQ